MEEGSRKRRETNDLCDHDADGWPAEHCVRLGIILLKWALVTYLARHTHRIGICYVKL